MKDKLCHLAIGAALWAVCLSATADLEPLTPLHLGERHPLISQNVSKLIEELHYTRPRLDNSLSSAILDRYLDSLDGNRMYFLARDIAAFGRYRYELDERARNGQLEPVFEIFNVFRERTRERITHALEARRRRARLHAQRILPIRPHRSLLAGHRGGYPRTLASQGQERRPESRTDRKDLGGDRRNPHATLRAALPACAATYVRRRVRDVHERRGAHDGPRIRATSRPARARSTRSR